MWSSLRLFMSLGVVILATGSASRSDGVRRNYASYADSPGYSLLGQSNNLGIKRKLVSLEGARSLIGHSLRVRKSHGFQNNFAHALRIRRGRQFDTLGHTLRIKRGSGNADSWKSRGYALRVRRGENDEQIEYPELESEALNDDGNINSLENVELMNRPESFEEHFDFDPTVFDSPQRRSGKGVRLHALRIKEDFLPNSSRLGKAALGSMFNSWAKRKSSLTHVLRVRKDQGKERDFVLGTDHQK